jgi:hypothetical protein
MEIRALKMVQNPIDITHGMLIQQNIEESVVNILSVTLCNADPLVRLTPQ